MRLEAQPLRNHQQQQPQSKPQQRRRLQQSPMQRYIASGSGSFSDEQGFRQFTATYLQAWYRKEQQRWKYTLERFPLYHIAALQIQYAWKTHYQYKLYASNRPSESPRSRAARVLQAAWKGYTHRRIFRYYRDLISFQNVGDPSSMLRAINPTEASLLDASMGAHVRFRLGGVSFPPTIYYKIFTKRPVCDLNAFSPKDYTISRQTAPLCHSQQLKTKGARRASTVFIRVGNSYYRAKQAEEETRHWYRRMENNGWRPVTAKVISEATGDVICQDTAKRELPGFHYSKLVRQQDRATQRRLKKRAWMQKLYTQGLLHPESPAAANSNGDDDNQETQETPGPDDIAATAEEFLFDVDFDNDQWEQDAEHMFQWADALDYDSYVANWHTVGKTATTREGVDVEI